MTQLSNTLTASMKTLPAGVIMSLSHNTSPEDYLLCDGSAVSRTTYANLFAAIGTTYGVGDGSTTFNVPDLRGIFPRSQGSQTITSLSHVGGSLGTKARDKTASTGITATTATGSATATVANFDAAHTHTWTDRHTAWPTSAYAFSGSSGTALSYTNNETSRTTGNPNTSLNHTHTITTNTVSSTTTFTGGSTETSPAYLAVQFVIKI